MQRGPSSKIRALFLDIDGTLVGADNQISAAVQRAVTKAQERGLWIGLCTGRTRYTAEPVAAQLWRPPDYLIVSNGAIAIETPTETLLHRRLLEPALALEVARILIDAGEQVYIYEPAFRPLLEESRVLYHPARPVGAFATPPRYQPYASLLSELPFTPVSVASFGPQQEMQALVKAMRESLSEDFSVIQSGTHALWGVEIFAAGVNKRSGAEMVARRLGISSQECMAIGDHMNDIELLEWAGIGVAMADAPAEVQAVADWITASVEEDGVAEAIERLLTMAA
ncbi:predicted HAD superfamily hydrolase [Chthonomonas calidirosea]|uniref:Cof-type HAD-IIB family hydrolase n=1 Tax=Chthonomonas calidirosea TaxID=454171 RepID=UPI0006DD556D|nr:Cof-type HAD-IIB family hydrolase [Chthonomonas calidirosea]CEK15415.1 predicted HAD superfamily hydrolase [Chthonomonas calidirosea]